MVAIHTSRGRRFSRGLGFIRELAADAFPEPAKATSPNPREVLCKKFLRVIVRFTSFPFLLNFQGFCKIEVRHTLKRKNCLLIFSFQTINYYPADTYLII
jgi:hypothetical protein